MLLNLPERLRARIKQAKECEDCAKRREMIAEMATGFAERLRRSITSRGGRIGAPPGTPPGKYRPVRQSPLGPRKKP